MITARTTLALALALASAACDRNVPRCMDNCQKKLGLSQESAATLCTRSCAHNAETYGIDRATCADLQAGRMPGDPH